LRRILFPNALLLTRALFAFVGAMPWVFALFGFDSPAIFGIFRGLCHQEPDRSLFLFGTQMAVCSRCAGVYAGLVVASLSPALGFMAKHGLWATMTAIFVAAFDVTATHFSLYALNHAVRLATGFLAGWTVSAFLIATLKRESQEGMVETDNNARA